MELSEVRCSLCGRGPTEDELSMGLFGWIGDYETPVCPDAHPDPEEVEA